MDITIIITKLKEEMKKLFATKEDVPTKTSDLINDNDFITMQNVKPTKLQNGDNIDDLLTQGCYWINSNPDAESINGTFPINGHYAYVILVDGSEKVIRQIATVYKGQGARTFVRMYSGYTSNYGWGEWKEVSFVGHAHGNLNNDGTITNADTSTNYTYFVGLDSNNAMRKVSKLKGSQVIDTTAHSNISSNANATQDTINTAIDSALGVVKDSLDGKIDSSLTYTTATGNNDTILCKTYDDGKIHTTRAIQANWVKDLIAHVGSGGIGSAGGDAQSSINTKINTALVNLKAAIDGHTHANISDTGWQEVTFESGYVKYGDPVRYRRIGKVVHIEGIIKNTSAFTPSETAQKVATISDIYCRPQYTQYGLMQGTGANKFLLSIQPNGNIGIARYGTTATSTQIGANSWLHCNLTWMVETENVSYVTSFDSSSGVAYYYPNGFSYSQGNPLPAPFKLQKDNGEGIANQSIKFYIDNTLKDTQTTDNNGYVLFEVPWATTADTNNTHTLRIDFNENAPYRSCTYTWTVGQNSNNNPIVA